MIIQDDFQLLLLIIPLILLQSQLQVFQFNISKLRGFRNNEQLTINSIQEVNQAFFYIFGLCQNQNAAFSSNLQKQVIILANKKTRELQFIQQSNYLQKQFNFLMFTQTNLVGFMLNIENYHRGESHLFMVDKSNNKIMKKQVFQNEKYFMNKFTASENSVAMLLEDLAQTSHEEQGEQQGSELVVRHIFNYRLQYLHCLLAENQEFDDDLLQEAIQLLTIDVE